MSGLYVIALASLWIWLSRRGIRAWRKARDSWSARRRWIDVVAMIAAMAWFGASFWFGGGQKIYWDARVRELCAKDGGVRVYETVRLPAYEYEQYVKKNWVLSDKSQATSADKYYVETDIHYYQHGALNMSRRQYRIIRRGDQKILGELIFYGRGGGDLPGPWHPSSFSCPSPTQVHFESEIFVKGNEQ